jgi:hypothetical protein
MDDLEAHMNRLILVGMLAFAIAFLAFPATLEAG